jgi:H+/Cl- antiporter ClcA
MEKRMHRQLAKLAVPAIIIGALAAVLLWAIDEFAHVIEHWIWDGLPHALDTAPDSTWWIIGVLTVTGVAVGAIIKYAPGHGGHDSATTELIAPVLPLGALPGVAAALILGLAGGVSLGPESPIIAIAIAVSVALCRKFAPRVPPAQVFMMAAAGMLGAMFGTPVAAALLLTETVAAAKHGGVLWDRLFGPVAAAGTAALIADALGISLISGGGLTSYTGPEWWHVLAGAPIALAAALIGIFAAWAMPRVWHLLRRLKNPLLYVTAGGLVLGILGAIGGPITLFKGSTQTTELIANAPTMTAWAILAAGLIKVLALIVASAAGFRGGRIFPSVFIGVAIGLTANALFPSVPLPLALACGVLGVVLAVGRDGWLALFLAVAVAGDITIISIMCIVVLPVWLLVTSAPEMIVHEDDAPELAAPDSGLKAT